MKPVNRKGPGRRDQDTIVALALWLGCSGLVAGCGANATSGSAGAPGAPATPADGGAAGSTGTHADGGGAGSTGTHADGGGAGRIVDGATEEPAEASSPSPMPTKIQVSPAFVANRPIADCSATLAPASKPIVLDASISCTPPREIVSLGAGLAGSGVVSVSGVSDSRLLAISAAGVVTGDQGPAGGIMSLAVQPAGAVDLVGYDGGLAFFHATNGGWMRELLVAGLPPLSPTEYFGVVGLGHSADGSAQLVYNLEADISFQAWMATRSPSGDWTQLPAPNFFQETSALAVPPTGPAMVVHETRPTATSADLDAWSNGADSKIVALDWMSDSADDVTTTAAATDASGALTASVRTPRGGVLVIRPASASPRTVLIPGTQDAAPVGCPPLPSMPLAAMAPRLCTETGLGGARHHTLVVAADGTAWLAYLLVHVDRDISQFCGVPFSGNGFACDGTIMTDRSTLELVLEHVAADGSHTVRWRGAAGVGADGLVFMDRRDALLHLAFSPVEDYLGVVPPTFHYLVIDTTGL
jgi:hypothetical protein